MAIPHKGTRTIVVEDELYRWAVKPDDENLTLYIQQDGSPNWTLRANLNAGFFWKPGDIMPGHWTSDGRPGTVVTPHHVRMAILAARAEGWQAQARTHRPFFLSLKACEEIERCAHRPNYTAEELEEVRRVLESRRTPNSRELRRSADGLAEENSPPIDSCP